VPRTCGISDLRLAYYGPPLCRGVCFETRSLLAWNSEVRTVTGEEFVACHDLLEGSVILIPCFGISRGEDD